MYEVMPKLRMIQEELMRVAYFPGCVAKGNCPELNQSTQKIAPLPRHRLGPARQCPMHRCRSSASAESGARRYVQCQNPCASRRVRLAVNDSPVRLASAACAKATKNCRRMKATVEKVNQVLKTGGHEYHGSGGL